MNLCILVTYKGDSISPCYFSFSGLPPFIEGRCPGSKAPIFTQSNPYATAPKISLNISSFTISCWIKQTKYSQMGVIYGDWHYRHGQFLLSAVNQSIVFDRQWIRNNGIGARWSLESTSVSLSDWTHVVVTWQSTPNLASIYVNGAKIAWRPYYRGRQFCGPTGKPYMIGNDGRAGDHQFHGSVMDLYVFDEALSLDEINVIRGVWFMSLRLQLKIPKWWS